MATTSDTSTPEPTHTETRSSRRNLLRLAGAAAVGGAATAVIGGGSADAVSSAWMTEASTTTSVTTSLTSGALGSLSIYNTNTGGQAVLGSAKNDGTGVHGYVDASAGPAASGVLGEVNANNGFGVVASGGSSQLLLSAKPTSGTPVTSSGQRGAIHANSTGLYYCVTGSTLFGDTWRTLADSSSAGVFHVVGPWRVYDSRRAAPGPQSPLTAGEFRNVSVADARDPGTGAVTHADVVPAGATAIAYNVTVVNTTGTNGFLAINPGANATVSASAINWSAPNLTLANASVVGLNNRLITVICGGTATSCDFIVDVVG